jgi:hypothetical protein
MAPVESGCCRVHSHSPPDHPDDPATLSRLLDNGHVIWSSSPPWDLTQPRHIDRLSSNRPQWFFWWMEAKMTFLSQGQQQTFSEIHLHIVAFRVVSQFPTNIQASVFCSFRFNSSLKIWW